MARLVQFEQGHNSAAIAHWERPQGAPYADWQRVQKVLQEAGFETE